MRVPLLDLSEQYRTLAKPIRTEIDAVLASQRFILGPQVEAFEKAICTYCGAPHAIGVSSGTDALLAILMALEIGRHDAVITTAYTFFATAGCIARVGARPVCVDIDPATGNISPAAIQRYIAENCQANADGGLKTKSGEKIRAIVPVHLFGLCAEMDAIHQISERYQLDVIEDAAQSIGAEYRFGERAAKAGTMGEAGYFSFYPSKNLGAAGDAGMLVCRDEGLATRLRVLRQHGMEPRYYHQVIGGNFRLDEIQSAILKVKLPHRNRGLTNHHIYHQYVIRTARRDQLREQLAKREIDSAIYYPLGLHEQKCFSYLGYKKGDLPETERAARETLALPIYPGVSREAQRYVVGGIAEFFE